MGLESLKGFFCLAVLSASPTEAFDEEAQFVSAIGRVWDQYRDKKIQVLQEGLDGYRMSLAAAAIAEGDRVGELERVAGAAARLNAGEPWLLAPPPEDVPEGLKTVWVDYEAGRRAQLIALRERCRETLQESEAKAYDLVFVQAAAAVRQLVNGLIWNPVTYAQFAAGPSVSRMRAEELAQEAGEPGPPERDPWTATVVFREGEDDLGRGFLCRLKGKTFAVTQLNAIARGERFRVVRSDGVPIRHERIFAAVGADLAIIEVEEGRHFFELEPDVSRRVRAGSAVIVPRIGFFDQVVGTVAGSVKGLGPTLVEVDAELIDERDGLPVVDPVSGRVVGVVSYTVELDLEALQSRDRDAAIEEVRSFSYRLDTVSDWEPINWPRFARQAAAYREIERTTEALIDRYFRGNQNGRMPPEISKARQRFIADRNRRNMTEDYYLQAAQTYLTRLQSIAEADIGAFRRRPLYDFFRRRAESQSAVRKAIAWVFEDEVKNLRNLR